MLVDTSVLARLLQPEHPNCEVARLAINTLIASERRLYVSTQNLVELWVVATRPVASNGLGLSAREASVEVSNIQSMFETLVETKASHQRWQMLVVEHAVLGKQAHDARIAALMLTHGIEDILTFDSDFDRFTAVRTVSPHSLVSRPTESI